MICALIIAISFVFFEVKDQLFVSARIAKETDFTLLPIIMYHEVKTYKLGKDVITPQEFENDLKFLAENNYTTITMAELIDYVYNDTPLPENPIILSFDDGYLNNYVYVLPLLKKYKMKIVFSVIGKNTDDFTDTPDKNLDYSHVTWSQLNEMIESGFVEVQNHTYNLHAFTKKRIGCNQKTGECLPEYEKVLVEDITKLQQKLQENTGQVPSTFAYPYGTFCDNTDTVLKRIGFKATLSCKYGINVITKQPNELYGLKRVARAHGISVKKLLSDLTKTLKYTDDEK